MFVSKGQRITAEWMTNARLVPLAGVMPKVEVTRVRVMGVVRHVRGDHPTDPKVIRFYVDPDQDWGGPTCRPIGCTCENEHVAVDPEHVTGVEG